MFLKCWYTSTKVQKNFLLLDSFTMNNDGDKGFSPKHHSAYLITQVETGLFRRTGFDPVWDLDHS